MKRILTLLLLAFLSTHFGYQASASEAAAAKKYRQKKYAEAASLYFKAYSRSKSRKAEYGLAISLMKLNLNYSASKYFSVIARRGRKASNPNFRKALEALGTINNKIRLGQSQIIQLFRTKVNASDVPGRARGFYFYYKGIESFSKKRMDTALRHFKKVPSGSEYYPKAVFHIGVISTLSSNHKKAISSFEKVLSLTRNKSRYSEMRELAYINIARINFEIKRFTSAIEYYGRIPRSSDHWLDAIWESSWGFFYMQKHNNTLGNIHTLHSPFFINRFYPESYILQAITFLRLCRYQQVNASMKRFKSRYKPVFKDIKSILKRYKSNPKGFYRLIYDYNNTEKTRYPGAAEILKKLTYLDIFRDARDTIRFSDRELSTLQRTQSRFRSAKLYSSLRNFLKRKKVAAVNDAGRRLYKQGTTFYSQLLELSNQTKLIVAEMQLGKLQKLRSTISKSKNGSNVRFIGGMQKLDIGQSLEFWPFNNEYWEDELGYYVFNVDSQCK